MVKITSVESGSRAARAGLLAGDTLVSINGNEINDVLDYRFYLAERSVELLYLRNSLEASVVIKKVLILRLRLWMRSIPVRTGAYSAL